SAGASPYYWPIHWRTGNSGAILVGHRHFGCTLRQYKHDAQASEHRRNPFTRLRFVLVFEPKVALSN
ncbi:MAG: hypothetical protein U9N87_04920, partial [Planctomycetota bacterium]|nr:hypothetical protein [Planctomycetota bacterium]